ncbi:MAG: TonB-dependent receptor, partial [Gammaproteobacteria bacterium]|nr:TonB-dependent receptor [Gammaproteobacteria bacterium]
HEVAQFSDPETEIETTGGSLRIEGSLTDSISLTSTTGYIDHQYGPQIYGFSGIVSNGLLTPSMEMQFGTIGRPDAPRVQTSESFSQELILTGTSDSLDWLVGFYYFQEDFDAAIPFEFVDTNVKALVGGSFTAGDPIVFPPGTLFFGNNQSIFEKNSNVAGFVDVTWRLAEDWRLNVGGRYGGEEKKTTQHLETILILPPNALLLPTGGSFTLPICPPGNKVDLKENKFSPKARLEWDPVDDHLTYLQYQEGVKSGQVNLSLCNDVVEPEEIAAYEFGYKAQFGSGRGTFNAAAFFYDYEQYQSLEFTVDGTSAYLTNVPKAEILGAEVELAYTVSESLAFDFAFTWLDSEVTQGSVETGTDTANLAAGVQNLEGNPLPSTPEFTFQAGLEHYAAFGEASLTTRLEYAYFDEHSFRLFGVRKVHPEDGQKSYGLLNLYATLSFADDRYQVRGYLRNLTDEDYKYWSLYSLSTGFSGSAAPPLTWGLDLVANF